MDYSFATVTELLYPLILGAGIFSSIRLLSLGTKEIKLANSLIVVLLLILMLPMWNSYVSRALSSDILKFGWPFNRSYWLIAPLMYLYLTEIFASKPNRRLYFIHALPFVAITIFEKIAPLDKSLFFKISLVIWVTLTLCYTIMLVRKLLQSKKQYTQTHSSALAAEFKWSLVLLFGLVVFIVFDMFLAMHIILGLTYPDSLVTIFSISRAVFVVSIVSYTLYYKLALKQPLDLTVELLPKKGSENQLRLTESAANSLVSILEQKMEEGALFSKPSLNLGELAAHLDVTTHQLSEVFNVHMDTTFYGYVNVKRINYAKTLLSEGSDKSIVDIAFQCGYGSKTTFYDNFKKICKMTPKEYRAALA